MAEVLLVANPHRRRRRNPRRRSRSRRSNPHHHRRRRSNPHRSRRRRSNPLRMHRRRRSNPFRMRRRRRQNPSLRGITGKIMPTVKAGFLGATGGLANDVISGLIAPYISTFLSSAGSAAPYVQYGVRMLTAIGVGMLGNMARFPGKDLADGAAICATHDFLRSQLQSIAPTLFGSGGTFALSGYSGLGAYLSGSAPIVGTATFPQTYLPQNSSAPGNFGAYLSGSSGMADGPGVWCDDNMGESYS